MLKRRPMFPPRPERDPAEFATWQPRPRQAAPSTGMPVVRLLELIDTPTELAEPLVQSSPAALAHMGRIKKMRCICCQLLGRQQQSITDVHHIREGRQARNDWLTIPLCHEDCHQGSRGVHGDRSYLRQLQVGEFTLLAITLEIYVKEHAK